MSNTTQRFQQGDSVWVTPRENNEVLHEGEGKITDVFDHGYTVLQEDEKHDSYGEGWCASDHEVQPL